MFDVARLRAETPGAAQLIHLNNAGAALQPVPVLNAVNLHLQREIQFGGYEAAELAGAALDRVYTSLARLLNASADEIAVIENATRAWDMVFYSLLWRAGDIILTSTTEYAGNYIPYLQLRKRHGVEIRVLPNDETGRVSLPDLERLLGNPRVRLISLPAIATNGGPLQPLEAIGALARAAGVLYLLDACQAVGHIPVDVRKIGCHFLTATSRKYLRGPRGMGFVYIESGICETMEPVFLDLHAATLQSATDYTIRPGARRFENWECNIAAKLGLGAAVDYALSLGMDAVWARIQTLARYLRDGLRTVPGIQVQDVPSANTGIVTFTASGIDAQTLRKQLAARQPRINISVSQDRATLLDMTARGLSEVARASVHVYNTEAEVDALLLALQQLSAAR